MWLLLVGGALLTWSIVVGLRIESRVHGWISRRIGDRWLRPLAVALGLQAAILVFVILVIAASTVVVDVTGSERSAAWVTISALVLGGPLLVCMVPGQFTGFADLSRGLEDRGTPRGSARAFVWMTAPFVFVWLAVAIAAVYEPFAP